ncbi:MAG TPA: polyprenol monophosphomannose synthase [Chloroflexi bacterium]|nr:polyprenol monophosphomannose synthase [Chloroflexota bacterium]
MADTLVIVPTYNERENIPRLIPMLLELPLDLGVIVVDDNSPDGTGELADALAEEYPGRVSVVHRAGKLGLGTAYLAGFRLALEQGAARVMTMDADFSHHPRYIPAMVRASVERYDLVIGSRYVPGGGTPDFPLRRRVLSRGANTFARFLLGLKARDATAGFRCYRRHVLEALPLDSIFSSGYSFLIEMLFLVQQAGFSVGEVPIVFEDRKRGRSKISQQEITKALYTVFRLSWRRMFGRDPRFLTKKAPT